MPFTFKYKHTGVAAVRNPIRFVIQADPAWASKNDYHIRCSVAYEPDYRSGAATSLSTLRGVPNSVGEVEFNFAPLLQATVGIDPPISQFASGAQSRICENLMSRYAIIFQEFEGTSQSGGLSVVPFESVINAGFATRQGQALKAHYDNNKFLTWQPRIKMVTEYQPEFLYWIAKGGDYMIRVKAYDDDRLVDTQLLHLITTQRYDVLEFPAGWLQLGLDSLAGGSVNRWTVQIVEGSAQSGGLIKPSESEIMEYQLDCGNCSSQTRYVVFQNSLGGYDTLRCTGQNEASFQVNKTTYRTGQGLASNIREVYSTVQGSNDSGSLNTGYMPKDNIPWVKDLLRSQDVYIVGELTFENPFATGDLIPVTLSGSARTYQDEDEAFGVRINWTEANYNQGV